LSIELVSIQGQIIDQLEVETFSGQSEYTYQLPHGLAEGQYILRLVQENWMINKVIKME
jgi:hypothetical protein